LVIAHDDDVIHKFTLEIRTPRPLLAARHKVLGFSKKKKMGCDGSKAKRDLLSDA
jgi:hypothetical protein